MTKPVKARRRPKTPEQRRIAAAQAMIRRCHSDAEFRKKMIAIWRAVLTGKTALSRSKASRRDV
jgi:hypothetical protein